MAGYKIDIEKATDNLISLILDCDRIDHRNLKFVLNAYASISPIETLSEKLFTAREPQCKHATIKNVFDNDLCDDCSDEDRVYLFNYEVSDNLKMQFESLMPKEEKKIDDCNKVPYEEFLKFQKRLDKIEKKILIKMSADEIACEDCGIIQTQNKCWECVEKIKQTCVSSLMENSNLSKNVIKIIDDKIYPSISKTIFVDGGHGKYSGDEGWGRVTDDRGKDILCKFEDIDGAKTYGGIIYKDVVLPVGKSRILVSKFLDVKSQQNNGAELIAMVTGLKIACILNKKFPGIITKICSDSELIVKWWSVNPLKKEKRKTMDPQKVKYVDALVVLRKQFESLGGTIEKISGDDNVSDLGYHV